METIKYGIIGSGKHALQAHALPGRDSQTLELIALCDVNEQSMANFAEAYGQDLEQYTDREAFLQSQIGAVLIGTPDEQHFDGLTAAIDAGKHVFVEKPLATRSEQVAALPGLLEKAEQNGQIVSSCHPRRFDPPFVWLKDNLEEFTQELGEPLALRFDFSYHKPSKEWKQDRGLLLDHANHEIDLADYLFGPDDFEAHRTTDTFDRYALHGMRKDGIGFEFTGTRRLNSANYLEWAGVRFERGDVTIDTHAGRATVQNHDTAEKTETEIPVTDYDVRGAATLENFGNAILGVEACYLTPEDLYVNTATSVYLTEQPTWRYQRGDH